MAMAGAMFLLSLTGEVDIPQWTIPFLKRKELQVFLFSLLTFLIKNRGETDA